MMSAAFQNVSVRRLRVDVHSYNYTNVDACLPGIRVPQALYKNQIQKWGYNAPIRLQYNLTEDDRFFLLADDSDEFNRWEAGQILARKLMINLVDDFQNNKPLVLNSNSVGGFKRILTDSSLDKEFVAKAITLLGEGEIMDLMEVADPDAVHTVRSFIRKQLASELKSEFFSTVENNKSSGEYVFDHSNMSRRALKNVALAYLGSPEDQEFTDLALQEYKTATNMTKQFTALASITQNPVNIRDDVLADFYEKWQNDYLVVNKWLALQAVSDIPGNVENMQKLLSHPTFDLHNPNKVYSLIGGFCGLPVNFHAKDGSGYEFLGDIVLQLDKINPQVASRMVPTPDIGSSSKSTFSASETTSNTTKDPFKIFESASAPTGSSSRHFTDPLEEISKFTSSRSTKIDFSSNSNDGVYDDTNSFDGLGNSVPAFSSEGTCMNVLIPMSETDSPAFANVRKDNGFSSFPSSTRFSQDPKYAPATAKLSSVSQFDELEDFCHGHDSRSIIPNAPNFDNSLDSGNDIEEGIIHAAIEASKRKAEENDSNHELGRQVNLSESGPNPRQTFVEDPELAHAISLSPETAEQEKARRVQEERRRSSLLSSSSSQASFLNNILRAYGHRSPPLLPLSPWCMKSGRRNTTFVGDGGGRSWRRSRRPRARARDEAVLCFSWWPVCLLALLVYEACKLVWLKQVKAYAGGSGFKVWFLRLLMQASGLRTSGLWFRLMQVDGFCSFKLVFLVRLRTQIKINGAKEE
ncbi:hypothetical protein RYX36_022596 [Vicia faba]